MSTIPCFDLVLEIQKERPDWRFSLLGGDSPREYKRSKTGKIIGYKKTRNIFGWKAEFFTTEAGERIASGNYARPNDAVLIATALARKAIKEGVK